jgi:RND family efflux transporter MFP subunit
VKKIFLVIAVFLLICGAIFLRYGRDMAVEVVRPTRGVAVQAVYATGTVEASVMMPISPRISARLMELLVDEGSNITKGQVLAKLEDENLQQGIKELQARGQFAKRDMERKAILVKRNALSVAEYDRARSEWESIQAATTKARSELDFMKLLAPADGKIIRRDGEIGQLIPANQPVFWLSSALPLRISAEVDEEDIPLVQIGQKVLIRADAFPNHVYHGEVQSITPKGDPVARSYRVRIAFTEETPLLIGMTAETNIMIKETKNALLIPSEAVWDTQFVWKMQGETLHKQAIEIGSKGLEETEVTTGLTEQDWIIRSPRTEAANNPLKEGQRIRPIFPQAISEDTPKP